MTTHQFITNQVDAGKYGLFVPRMIIEDLDPYQLALWVHYAAVCAASKQGVCFEKVETTATKTRMSAGMVVKTRDQLAAIPLITVTDHPVYRTKVIELIDVWPQNMLRYGSRSPHEPIVVVLNPSVLDSDQQQQLTFFSVHGVNDSRLNALMEHPRLGYLIATHGLLNDVPAARLIALVEKHGIDRVAERARWYCWSRDRNSALTGGWLAKALEDDWPPPKGWRDEGAYLSEEENLKRWQNDSWDNVER